MTKIRITQFLLLLLGITIILFTYFNDQNKKVEQNPIVKTEAKTKEDTLTTFENIKYTGFDNKGNRYEIISKFAETNKDKPDLTYMKFVVAHFYYKDGRIVRITSDRGIYNKANSDIFFEENVKMVESDNTLLADNLDVFASKNLIKAYNNIEFFTGKNLVYADQIDIDLTEKTSKISMYNNGKIKIKLVK